MAATTAAHHQDLFSRTGTSNSEVVQRRYLSGSGGYGVGEDSARDSSNTTASNSRPRASTARSAVQINGRHSPELSTMRYQGDLDQVQQPQHRMYVRALYNFTSDDPTSLSFSKGDLIEVLTQLESGWWDGVVHGQRGWFPSNYCQLVSSHDFSGNGTGISPLDDSDDMEDSSYDYDDDDSDKDEISSPQLPMEGTDDKDADEAAFWIPQATPDGRLYYFNTQTGDTKTELPLETPSSTTETGPRNRNNFSAPDSTKPPSQMTIRGHERERRDRSEEDDDDGDSSTSDRDGEVLLLSTHTPTNTEDQRRSFISEDSSPQSIRSKASMNFSNDAQSERTLVDNQSTTKSIMSDNTVDVNGDHVSNAAPEKPAQVKVASSQPSTAAFYDDGIPVPTSWDALLEETRLAIERYRQAINNRDRHIYVRRAEDISDMLRLLIAAGSSTTDNHSGQPSIISTNKALHPHFRHFMAAFSKLVLSSHIASADWPPPDAESKCLSEADEVLTGVSGFAEVARGQKKDILPRLKPGFVMGSSVADGWKGQHTNEFTTSPSNDNGGQNWVALLQVDNDLVEQMEASHTSLRPTLRRLDTCCETADTLTTPYSQSVLCNYVIQAAQQVVAAMKKYFGLIDRIDLTPFTTGIQSPTYIDFSNQKQRLYDSFADLIMSCQALTAPLADEWSQIRCDSLDERLANIRVHIKEVESGIQTLAFSTGLLVVEKETKLSTQNELKGIDLRKPSDSISSASVHSRTRPARQGSSVGDRAIDRPQESKAARVLGFQPQTQLEPAETPWFLGCDHDHEIMYGGKKREVKGGTLVALVERLTRHDNLDSNFINTLLLTYQSFTTADELFNHLVRRFTIQPPPNLTQAEFDMWVDKKQKLIRVRVLSVLKQWLESFWMEKDDDAGKELLRKILTFAKDVMLPYLGGTTKLLEVVETRLKGQAPELKKMVQNLNTAAPPPILPRSLKKLKFLDIDPLEFARQLTIIESRAYSKLKPTDCLNKAWSKDARTSEGSESTSNVRSIILHSNQLTNWVAEMILTQLEVRRRVVVIKHFIAVAEKCRQLNNFSTLTSIISALGAAPIHRLKRTWDHVPTRTTAILESMKVLMGTTLNFNEYRECLHLVNPPCVPFLGVYLKDLTFVADGNPDFIKGTDLINFGKRAKTAAIIREIQQYQSVPYPFTPVPELQDYILSNMQAAKDVTDMFNVSLTLEPREREDEKIARL